MNWVINIKMRIKDICLAEWGWSHLFKKTQQLPKPTKTAKEFARWARTLPQYGIYHEGSILTSEFVQYDIESWHRENDPRLKAVDDTIKQGIVEPVSLGQPGKGRVAVVDGGHRITSAVNLWLKTGQDTLIPFYFHSRKKSEQA